MSLLARSVFLGIFLLSVTAPNGYTQQGSGAVKPWVLAGEKGDYKFFNYNDTQIRTKIIDILQNRSKEDRDYFLQTVERVESGFAGLLERAIYFTPGSEELAEFNEAQKRVDQKAGGLVQIQASQYSLYGLRALSDASMLNQDVWIPVADLAASIRRFQKEVTLLRAKIAALTSLADGAFPSQTQGFVDEDGKPVEYREYGANLNFKPIVTYFEARLAEVEAYVQTLEYKVIMSEGTKGQSKGLNIPKALFAISPEKAREIYNTEILPLLGWNPDQRETVEGFNNYLRRLIQTFIERYGTTERYRVVDGDPAKTKERNEQFQLIVKAFWFRSYIRAIYGTPVGSLSIRYDKKIFHIDRFWNSTDSLGNFLPETAWSDSEQAAIRDQVRNALSVAGERSVRILTDGDVGFLAKANSFFTYVGGKRNLADVNLMILQLIAADLFEDQLIKSDNGLEKMVAQYQKRYYATDETSSFYQGLEDTYFPEEDAGANPDNTSAFADKNTFPFFVKSIGFLGDTKMNELAQVQQRKEMLEAFFKANGIANSTKKRRRGRLRGK